MWAKHKQTGFTIVELLIVIVIIAILATVTIIAYNGINARAKVASIQADLQGSSQLLAIDNTTTGTYPATLALANNGKGLLASNGATYTYKYNGGDNSYCLQETSGSVTYSVTSSSNIPQVSTGCPIIVSTFAGSGSTGSNDGNGASAQFSGPWGMAYDSSTNAFFVTDWSGAKIRKVTPSADVSTVVSFPFAIGIAAKSGVLYVADSNNSAISKVDESTGATTAFVGSSAGYAEGTGSAAKFNSPRTLVVDSSGNLFVADWANQCIRKVTPGGTTSDFAGLCGVGGSADGTGTAARFNGGPYGIAIDSSNVMYVTDQYNGIRKITPAGVVTTIVSGFGTADGPLSSAKVVAPSYIAINAAGDTLYFIDQDVNTSAPSIRSISLTNNTMTTVAGGVASGFQDGVGTVAKFGQPDGIAISTSGLILLNDYSNSRVRSLQ